jgi:uncharacterized membrane protein YjfL (UPF0719 family)
MHYPPESLAGALLAAFMFGVLGIVLLIIGFKAFDIITPKLDLEKELMAHNLAVAIVLAAVVIGVCWIIISAMA